MSAISATGRYTPRSDIGQFIATKIVPGLLEAVDACGQIVEDEAKLLCPVRTGALRDSIGHRVDQTGSSVYSTVYAGEDYAGYVEMGTGIRGAASPGAGPYEYSATWPGMEAQPYLRPALDSTRDQNKTAFVQHGGVYLKAA